MRKFPLVIIFISFFAFSDSPFEPFTGTYHISGAPISDTKSSLPENTHIYFNVSGEAAHDIYFSLSGKPKLNKCGVDHYEKSSGDFTCSYYPSEDKYSCDFSLNIQAGKLDSGGVC